MTDQPLQKTDPQAPAENPSENVLLTWSSQPARKRPIVAVILTLFLVSLVVIVQMMTHTPFFSAIAALILWGSLSQFYLSTTFTLTDNGIRVKYVVNKIEKSWSQYRSYYVDKNGVLLSPFLMPSRLENFRGIYIRFDNNKDQVMEIVKQKITMEPK